MQCTFSENESEMRPQIGRAQIVSEVAETLIEAGVDVKATNWFGNTVLHYAAIYNRLEIGRMLIDAGVDVRVKNDLQLTPLYFADANGEFAKMLQEKI